MVKIFLSVTSLLIIRVFSQSVLLSCHGHLDSLSNVWPSLLVFLCLTTNKTTSWLDAQCEKSRDNGTGKNFRTPNDDWQKVRGRRRKESLSRQKVCLPVVGGAPKHVLPIRYNVSITTMTFFLLLLLLPRGCQLVKFNAIKQNQYSALPSSNLHSQPINLLTVGISVSPQWTRTPSWDWRVSGWRPIVRQWTWSK